MATYIWQQSDWPDWTFDLTRLATPLASVRHAQGRLLGRMESLGFKSRDEAWLQTLTEDVVKTSEIEGDPLDSEQVRSSIVRRLGMDVGALPPVDRHVEGIVEVMLDATQNYAKALTVERLFSWHGALFPTGRSGLVQIRVAVWRDDADGPMQVLSGPVGREKVHYTAPRQKALNSKWKGFLPGSSSLLIWIRCLWRGWHICGLSLCTPLMTAMVVSPAPLVILSWRVQNTLLSDFIAFLRKYNRNVLIITPFWRGPRRVVWM